MASFSSPDIENLHFSESGSDTEDPFASPSGTPSKSKRRAAAAAPLKSSEQNRDEHQQIPESKYDAEQAREESLRRELEGVRNINEVIEGVISSLESAKGNMAVRINSPQHAIIMLTILLDRITNCYICFCTSKYMDQYPFTNRT